MVLKISNPFRAVCSIFNFFSLFARLPILNCSELPWSFRTICFVFNTLRAICYYFRTSYLLFSNYLISLNLFQNLSSLSSDSFLMLICSSLFRTACSVSSFSSPCRAIYFFLSFYCFSLFRVVYSIISNFLVYGNTDPVPCDGSPGILLSLRRCVRNLREPVKLQLSQTTRIVCRHLAMNWFVP